jgi:nucleotide-binding universal stress UspA family protein
MFTRLLVPTDFSPPSDAALAYARTLAGAFGASLHVLNLTDNLFMQAVVTDRQTIEAAALRSLSDRLSEDDRRRFHVVAAVEQSDAPADEIASYARTHGINLVVMGTHGRSGVSHLLLGSVAEKVVRTSPCPVLTVREAPPGSKRTSTSVTKILVPTDFSPPSDTAAAYGRKLATVFGASQHLLHVLEDPLTSGAFGSEFYLADPPDARMARLKDAQERLAHRVAAHDPSGTPTTTEVIFGRSVQTIVDYAADNEFDLIVMGTHGRSGVAHLLMGSVAESVVRTAPCPVLTVRGVAEAVTAPSVNPGAVEATT